MRTSIVLWQVFYCSIAYSEGGRLNFLFFSAYVIKVWPLSMSRKINEFGIDSLSTVGVGTWQEQENKFDLDSPVAGLYSYMILPSAHGQIM